MPGAYLEITNKNGETALIMSTSIGDEGKSEEAVQFLVDAGANLDAQNKYGYTALMFACQYSIDKDSEPIVELLLSAGANPNLQNKDGETALILASESSSYQSSNEIVEMLVEDEQTNLNIQDKYGNTALMLASEDSDGRSSEKTVKLLLEHGADIMIQNYDGVSALSSDDLSPNVEKMIHYREIFDNNIDILKEYDNYILDLEEGFLHVGGGCFDLDYSDKLKIEDWRAYR